MKYDEDYGYNVQSDACNRFDRTLRSSIFVARAPRARICRNAYEQHAEQAGSKSALEYKMAVLSKLLAIRVLASPVSPCVAVAMALVVAINSTRKRRREGGGDFFPFKLPPGGRGGTREDRKPLSPRYKNQGERLHGCSNRKGHSSG